MRKMMVAACAVVALAAFAKTPEEVPKEHRYPDAAQGGHLLVLQCGSDWCESGEWIARAARPLEGHRAFADSCAEALKGWRQPPIEVQLSGDGKEWRTVFSDDAVRTEYRVDLGDKSVVAKFVRVRRVPGAREDFFHLNKILVYGDRMY